MFCKREFATIINVFNKFGKSFDLFSVKANAFVDDHKSELVVLVNPISRQIFNHQDHFFAFWTRLYRI